MSLLSFFHFFHSKTPSTTAINPFSAPAEDNDSIFENNTAYLSYHDSFNEYYYGSYHGLGICPNHYKED
jgi:hypothetical protein